VTRIKQTFLFTPMAAGYLCRHGADYSPRTLENWRTARRQTGPRYIRLSYNRVVYRQADLDAWLRRRVVDPSRAGRGRRRSAR
jgi:hypothetical protein